MIYDKTRALEPGYYDQFEMVYKPALEKDRKDAERYRCLRAMNAIDWEKFKYAKGFDCDCGWFQHPQLNQCVDDYDLTSNDTRRGD